jgi:hypothetical protein
LDLRISSDRLWSYDQLVCRSIMELEISFD